MTGQQKLILMAVIGRPHGIKGEVNIRYFSADPFALAQYEAIYDDKGQGIKISNLRLHKNRLIGQIDGINNRNQAQFLQGVQLFIDRQSFADELEEDEFYQVDLIGFRVMMLEGGTSREIGRASTFFNFGAGDLLEITDETGKSRLIPFNHAAVPVIDLKGEFMVVDEVGAGLAIANDAFQNEKKQAGKTKIRGK